MYGGHSAAIVRPSLPVRLSAAIRPVLAAPSTFVCASSAVLRSTAKWLHSSLLCPKELIHLLFDRTITDASVSVRTLFAFSTFYFGMSSLSNGMAVPGGLFIPSIVIGGSGGRMLGVLFERMLPAVNPGVYAVLGASAMLGGVTRMTLPISVMMIEITSDAQFLIPIMLVVLVAKATADLCIKPTVRRASKDGRAGDGIRRPAAAQSATYAGP